MLNTCETVLRIFNRIFTGCELVITSAVKPKECISDIRCVSGTHDRYFNCLCVFCMHSKYFYHILLDL